MKELFQTTTVDGSTSTIPRDALGVVEDGDLEHDEAEDQSSQIDKTQ